MSFLIMGTYKGQTEEVDSTETAEEAETLLSEYRMAFGSDWTLEIHIQEEA